MLKLAVFDSGWGGEQVADYLERELPLAEIVRVIDWRNAPYEYRTFSEICQLAERALRPYVGRTDAIILGGFVPSIAANYLRSRYPSQVFIDMPIDLPNIKFAADSQVLLLGSAPIRSLPEHQKLLRQLQKAKLKFRTPECRGWTQLIDGGEFSDEILQRDLESYLTDKVSCIIALNTHFWGLRSDLRRIAPGALFYTGRDQLLNEICHTLKLRGGQIPRRNS